MADLFVSDKAEDRARVAPLVAAAFAALDRAYALRDPRLTELRSDPMVAPLHADPRFAALMSKIGFPQSRCSP